MDGRQRAALARRLENTGSNPVGATTAYGLDARIRRAAALAFVINGESVVGVAALKRPEGDYRKSVSSKAGVSLPRSAFAYELGWVFVVPTSRRHGLSGRLVDALTSAAGGKGLFATSRFDNTPMHRGLARSGFATVGKDYLSEQGRHRLRLFVRDGGAGGAAARTGAETP